MTMTAPVARATKMVKTGMNRCPVATMVIMIINEARNKIAYLTPSVSPWQLLKWISSYHHHGTSLYER